MSERSSGSRSGAQRRRELDLQHLDIEAAIREHQTTTAILVAIGVVIGVLGAAWAMSRPVRDQLGAEDPEAPLFI